MTFHFIKFISVFALMVLFACGDGAEKKAELPIEFENNTEVQEYFETLDRVIDEYVSMSEKIIETGQKSQTSNEEPSFSDAMEMFNTVTSSTLKMAPLLEKMQDLEDEAEILKEDMTSEEIEMFSKTYTKMMQRFYEMSNNLN